MYVILCIIQNKLILEFKKLRLFVNKQNLKIDIVLKASHAIAIR